jgi:hypothetical protein
MATCGNRGRWTAKRRFGWIQETEQCATMPVGLLRRDRLRWGDPVELYRPSWIARKVPDSQVCAVVHIEYRAEPMIDNDSALRCAA